MTATPKSETSRMLPRAWRFLHRPRHEKLIWLRGRWETIRLTCRQAVLGIPVPFRLTFGAWWLARNDSMRKPLLAGTFEKAELAFVERLLQPGMTVLDIGAHHGLYTLLASKRVGSKGRVIAFEPSPRERKALRLHLTLNQCKNVTIQELAVGEENADSLLHVVEGWASGCNSLRQPAAIIGTSASPICVHVARLDDWLASNHIDCVDFIKLDIEGAELSALKGAALLLQRRPRPVILAEVEDVRTLPWGYRAKNILDFLTAKGYLWLAINSDGTLRELDLVPDSFEGNFVACPEERIRQLEPISLRRKEAAAS